MLEALFARQQRPGAQNGHAENKDQVRSVIFQWSRGELGEEYIWFPGDLVDTGSYFSVVVTSTVWYATTNSFYQ
jgi:hypothetical protein